ncbi:MAG: triose-phosphate isomerase [Patescibacteria group bacterium]
MPEYKIIVANWKMQLTVSEAKQQALNLKKLLGKSKIDKNIEIVICPDFLSLVEVADIFKGSRVKIGAQDGFYEEAGAYTGQISLSDLKASGCQYVILGHSEKRNLGETDIVINKKVRAALAHGLTPIICVGETFEERKEGQKDLVVMHQVYQALHEVRLKPKQKIVIAYEPVWVIGSGQAIGSADAYDAALVIGQSTLDVFEKESHGSVSIIYGGSVNPENIKDFTGLPNISGALVGGASLDAKTFVSIIKNI